MKGLYNIGYTFGVFDIFHIEHLDQIKEARSRCDHLVVGVLSDEVVAELTGTGPVNPFSERLAIVRSLEQTDSAFGQMTSDLAEVWDQLRFDSLLLGVDVPGTDRVPGGLHEAARVEQLPRVRRSSSGLVVRQDG